MQKHIQNDKVMTPADVTKVENKLNSDKENGEQPGYKEQSHSYHTWDIQRSQTCLLRKC